MRGGSIALHSDRRPRPAQVLRTALFVDYDNIYIALRDQDEQAADRFRSNPGEWLGWLESQLPQAYQDLTGGAVGRRILIRRCYANPRTIGNHRAHFVRAGFEVIDTPPLTSQGKTSADIHMVIDMLDALHHPTRFDEFLVCSGDADFTPVLLRLRKHDRRTAVLAVGPASGAYTAACDLTLSEDAFLDEALIPEYEPPRRGGSKGGTSAARSAPKADRGKTLEKIETTLYEEVSLRGGVEAHNLIGIYKRFPEFTAGQNWLDHYSLRAMTEAVVATRDRLTIVDDDQWWVGPVAGDRRGGGPSSESKGSETPGSGAGSEAVDDEEIADLVWDLVEDSDRPISLAAVGQHLMDEVGETVKSRWQKIGSLKAYIEVLDLGHLEIAPVGPGWLYDPDRHEAPSEPGESGTRLRDLPEIGRKVCNLIDLPPLNSDEYGTLLRELEREVNENGYHISQTSKAVRDRLNGKGVRIARSQVSFILKGLAYSGFRFVQGDVSAAEVGRQLVANTQHLLGRIQIVLEPDEKRELETWLTRQIEADADDGYDAEDDDEDEDDFDDDTGELDDDREEDGEDDEGEDDA